MTPEQRASMFNQMKNISPDMLRQSQEAMKNMKPSDFENFDPNSLNQFEAQQKYLLNGAISIKNDGNAFVKSGDYSKALGKYNEALEKLKTLSSEGRKTEEIACKSNAAMCLLKLNRYGDAFEMCEGILMDNPKHVKGLFRRGQARASLGNKKAALIDIKAAFDLSPEDNAIKMYLDELKVELGDELTEGDIEKMIQEEEERLAAISKEKSSKEQEDRAKEISKMMGMDESAAKLIESQMRNTSSETFQKAANSHFGNASSEIAQSAQETGVKIEEVDDDEFTTVENTTKSKKLAPATTAPGNFPANGNLMENITPEMTEKMMNLFSSATSEEMSELMELSSQMLGSDGTPDMSKAQNLLATKPGLVAKLMKGMLGNMSDSEMENMSASMGIPKESLKSASKTIANFDEKTAEKVLAVLGKGLWMWQQGSRLMTFLISRQVIVLVACVAIILAICNYCPNLF